MAKFYGAVGYVRTVANTRGVFTPVETVRMYSGDVIRNTRRLETENTVNADIVISNEISIIADPYAMQNFHAIRYVEYLNSKWTVSNVRVEYPRLILTLGQVYNGS